MALTVAALEADLLVLVGPYLVRVGLDGTTADGTNAALRIPIRRAMTRMEVDSAGLDAIENTADHETLLDLAELKALEICWGNWAEVDQEDDGTSQKLSQLADRLKDRIEALKASLGPLADEVTAYPIPGASAGGIIETGRCIPGSLSHGGRFSPWDWCR